MARKQRQAPTQSGPGAGPGGGRRRGRMSDRFRPRKYTRINVEHIDYKDLNTLRRFMSDRGKVRSRRVTGLSRGHQAELGLAIRRARELALLPYVGER
jgi:small subunit ribosomal protein S18